MPGVLSHIPYLLMNEKHLCLSSEGLRKITGRVPEGSSVETESFRPYFSVRLFLWFACLLWCRPLHGFAVRKLLVRKRQHATKYLLAVPRRAIVEPKAEEKISRIHPVFI